MGSKPDAILIDDCLYIRELWQKRALAHSLNLLVLESPQGFKMDELDNLRNTPIFIDVSIKSKQDGYDFALSLVNKGYLRIYLATGHQSNNFQNDRFAGVIGKEIPHWLLNSKKQAEGA